MERNHPPEGLDAWAASAANDEALRYIRETEDWTTLGPAGDLAADLTNFYELEYKLSKLRTSPFTGTGREKILSGMERLLVAVSREVIQFLIPVYDKWLHAHALTDAKEWADARMEELRDSDFTNWGEDMGAPEAIGSVVSNVAWSIDPVARKFSPYGPRPNYGRIVLSHMVGSFEIDELPAWKKYVELVLQDEKSSWEGDDEEENPYEGMDLQTYWTYSFSDLFEGADYVLRAAFEFNYDLGIQMIHDLYEKVQFPSWYAEWKPKGIDETRGRIEKMRTRLGRHARSNRVGDLVSTVNLSLNMAHQTGSMMDYVEEMYPDVDRNFLDILSGKRMTRYAGDPWGPKHWDTELSTMGLGARDPSEFSKQQLKKLWARKAAGEKGETDEATIANDEALYYLREWDDRVFYVQDETAERLVHSDKWKKGNFLRERLENAGDILREFAKVGGPPSWGYIAEKLRRIDFMLKDPNEALDQALADAQSEKNQGVLDELRKSYMNMLIGTLRLTKEQRSAIWLVLYLAEGKWDKARLVVQRIRGFKDRMPQLRQQWYDRVHGPEESVKESVETEIPGYGLVRANPVGKRMGNSIYAHRDYQEDVVPIEKLQAALKILQAEYADHAARYNAIKFDRDSDAVTFQYSPDFDTADEPTVGDSIRIAANGMTTVTKQKSDPQIWHHKWMWVADDYPGFDVEKSKQRSRRWLPHVKKGESSKIGTKSYWDSIRPRWEGKTESVTERMVSMNNMWLAPSGNTYLAYPEHWEVASEVVAAETGEKLDNDAALDYALDHGWSRISSTGIEIDPTQMPLSVIKNFILDQMLEPNSHVGLEVWRPVTGGTVFDEVTVSDVLEADDWDSLVRYMIQSRHVRFRNESGLERLAVALLEYRTALEPDEVTATNKTCRTGHTGTTWGDKSKVHDFLKDNFSPEDGTILDFGAGNPPTHGQALRDAGWNVDFWEHGDNFDPKVHTPDALEKQYDVVIASKVLNVQPNEDALRATIHQMHGCVKPEGVLVANYPDPRKVMKWEEPFSPKEIMDVLEEFFGEVKYAKGTSSSPIFVSKQPKEVEGDMAEATIANEEARMYLAEQDYGYEDFHGHPIHGWVDPEGNFERTHEHATWFMETFPEVVDEAGAVADDWGDVPDQVMEIAYGEGWIATGPGMLRLGRVEQVTDRQMMALRGLYHRQGDEPVTIEVRQDPEFDDVVTVKSSTLANAESFEDLMKEPEQEIRPGAEGPEYLKSLWTRKAAGERGVEEAAVGSGEWWVEDTGQVIYADGDIGDTNHAVEAFQSILAGEGIYLEDPETPELIAMEPVDEETEAWLREQGVSEDVLKFLAEGGDPREWMIEHSGWIRLQGNSAELWDWNDGTLDILRDGLFDAWSLDSPDEEDLDMEVDIEEASSRQLFSVPLRQLMDDRYDAESLRRLGMAGEPEQAPADPFMRAAWARKVAGERGVEERYLAEAVDNYGYWILPDGERLDLTGHHGGAVEDWYVRQYPGSREVIQRAIHAAVTEEEWVAAGLPKEDHDYFFNASNVSLNQWALDHGWVRVILFTDPFVGSSFAGIESERSIDPAAWEEFVREVRSLEIQPEQVSVSWGGGETTYPVDALPAQPPVVPGRGIGPDSFLRSAWARKAAGERGVEEQLSDRDQDAEAEKMLARYGEQPTNIWMFSDLPMKDRIAWAYLAADRFKDSEHKGDMVRAFIEALKMVVDDPKTFWDQIKDKTRRSYMENAVWSIERVNLADVGVYPRFSGFSDEYCRGNVLDTAEKIETGTEQPEKVAKLRQMKDMYVTLLKFLPPILVAGGTLRGRKEGYEQLEWDIDDGNHRLVAAAMDGATEAICFVGRRGPDTEMTEAYGARLPISGWLKPDGEFIPSKGKEHGVLARRTFRHAGKRATKKAFDAGWIRFGDMGIQLPKPSERDLFLARDRYREVFGDQPPDYTMYVEWNVGDGGVVNYKLPVGEFLEIESLSDLMRYPKEVWRPDVESTIANKEAKLYLEEQACSSR